MKDCPVKPIRDKILIKMCIKEEAPSPLIIPDIARVASQEAEVLALGNGLYTKRGVFKFCVEVGDRIVVGVGSGADVEYDGVKYKIIRNDDIIAKVKKGFSYVEKI